MLCVVCIICGFTIVRDEYMLRNAAFAPCVYPLFFNFGSVGRSTRSVTIVALLLAWSSSFLALFTLIVLPRSVCQFSCVCVAAERGPLKSSPPPLNISTKTRCCCLLHTLHPICMWCDVMCEHLLCSCMHACVCYVPGGGWLGEVLVSVRFGMRKCPKHNKFSTKMPNDDDDDASFATRVSHTIDHFSILCDVIICCCCDIVC